MFNFTCMGWVLFRARSLEQILEIFRRVFTGPWQFSKSDELLMKILFFLAVPLLVLVYEYFKDVRLITFRSKFMVYAKQSLSVKSTAYGILAYLMCLYAAKTQSFIYFQF